MRYTLNFRCLGISPDNIAEKVNVLKLMGRDYESAVMSVGFFGFMMGTTANAMASMKTIVEKYGSSKHAFLVVSMVGAFFIDFTNALIINLALQTD